MKLSPAAIFNRGGSFIRTFFALSLPEVFSSKEQAEAWGKSRGFKKENVMWPVTIDIAGFYEVSDESVCDRV